MDRIIDIIAITSIAIFLIGLIIAIWGGTVGIQIALTAAVVFTSDWMLSKAIKQDKEEKER